MAAPEPSVMTVTAAVMVRGDHILIARRPAGDRLAGYWEFPGGKLEDGETPRDCLQRELHEEFGVQTCIGSFLTQTEYHDDHIAVRLLVFWAEIEEGEIRPTAHDAIRWVRPHQMRHFHFAPADRPIVARLQVDGPIRPTREGGIVSNPIDSIRK